MAARLPRPGADEGQWGGILNDYLAQAHKSDGTLKDNIVTSAIIANGAVAEGKLAPDVQTKLNTAAGAQGATGPQGVAGTAGVTGATGPAGQDGTSVNIEGSVATSALLPTGFTIGDAGTGYLTNDDGHLHIWSGTVWTDAGEIRGPQGATGPAGVGTQGATGATGLQGQPGATGAGTVGATGATGPAGATTWAGITGKPTIIGAGATAADARSAIGAGVSNLTLGTTNVTALAGDTTAASIGGVTGGAGITHIVAITQVEYDALPSPNASTLYVIVE